MKKLLTIAMILAVATAAQAAVSQTVGSWDAGVATPGLAGYTTYTLTLVAPSNNVTTLEFGFGNLSANQVMSGLSWMQDANGYMAEPMQDTQALFSADEPGVGPGVTVVGNSESTSSFIGSISGFVPFLTRDVFQLCVQTGTALPLGFGHMRAVNADEAGVLKDVEIVPEPATLSLLGLGGLALIRRRR